MTTTVTGRRFPTLRPFTARLAPVLLVGLLLTGCGDDSADTTVTDGAADTTVTDEATAGTAERVEITVQDGNITPLGERVEVGVGETLELEITADAPGELHVHSTPEQEIAFDEGTQVHELVIDRPGVVEVETHDPSLVILQLEVR